MKLSADRGRQEAGTGSSFSSCMVIKQHRKRLSRSSTRLHCRGMDGWTDRWMDKWMDRQKDRWREGWTSGLNLCIIGSQHEHGLTVEVKLSVLNILLRSLSAET